MNTFSFKWIISSCVCSAIGLKRCVKHKETPHCYGRMINSRVNLGGPSWAVGVGRSYRMTEMQSVREREGEMSAERVRDEQIYSIKVERKRDG